MADGIGQREDAAEVPAVVNEKTPGKPGVWGLEKRLKVG